MVMYTEMFVSIELKQDTPSEVIDVLKAMCDMEPDADCLKDKPRRWAYMFNSGSYYTPDTSAREIRKDKTSGRYSLIGKGDIKNYDSEIEQFFEFVKPWSDREDDFIGFMRYEEAREPTLIYSGA